MELKFSKELSFPVVECVDIVVEILSFVFVLWCWTWDVALLNHEIFVRVVWMCAVNRNGRVGTVVGAAGTTIL